MGELLQIIGLDGSYDEGMEPELGEEDLLRMYESMVLVRILDTRCMGLQRQGRIGFYIPSHGEEAVQVGSAYALRPEDWVVPAYREQGAALLRGLPLRKLVANLYGNREDIVRGHQMPNHFSFREGHFVSTSSPVGTQIPIGAGMGWAARLRGDPVVALVYFGDGATSQGDFHAGLNFAAVFRANTVFLCKNNQWAISLPVTRQTAAETIAGKGEGYGMRGVRVDGNDVLAVYAVCWEAVERAREGGGPTLIEAVTYRLGPHTTSDDPTRYRSQEEVEEWKGKDPLPRFQRYLQAKGIWDEELEAQVRQEAEAQVEDAIRWAEKVGPPDPATIFEDVYAETPWNLREQREAFLRPPGRS